MILLDSSQAITVDGVTVLPDHADRRQFWYLPAPVSLARRQDGRAQFTFIKYKPAAVEAGVKGGGFLMFESSLRLPSETERKIRSRLSSIARDPILTPVPFDQGTVEAVALNLQGSGGTKAEDAPEGTFNAVEKILGATTPSLQGDNTAAFSLTLDQEGAIILEQAFTQATTPIGVLYDLKFTGIRPALEVKITADFKRIYNHFSASLSAQIYWFQIGIEAAIERLVQDGAITIEVLNFSTEGDRKEKERWATEFFVNKLIADWFQPTLTPGQLQGGTPPPAGGGTPPPAGGGTPPPTGGGGTPPPAGGGTPPPAGGGTPPPAGGGTPPPAGGTPPPVGGTPPPVGGTPPPVGGTPPPGGSIDKPPAAAAPAGPLTAATLQVDSTEPNPKPAGYDVTLVAGSTGTIETIVVPGGSLPPVVRVDGVARTPNLSRQLTVDVQPGATVQLEIVYPATPDTTETFRLLFDKGEPAEAGWAVGTPPSGMYGRYVTGTPRPADDAQFNASVAPASTAPRGAAALRAWIEKRLATPKQLELDAHASFEGDTSAAKRAFNQRLSERRLDVAKGIVGDLATMARAEAHGQDAAEAANRRGQQSDSAVNLVGRTGVGQPQVTLRARLSRPAAGSTPPPGGGTPPPGGGTPPPGGGTPPPGGGTPPPGGGTPPPGGGTPPPGGGTPPPGGGTPPPQGGTAANAALSLKLKFVHQEELKTVTLHYRSAEAVQRTYAPQGFFGLMLDDLEDKDSYFVEVDLDDPFFRVFSVTVDAPIDFASIGLDAAHLALDYGSTSDPANHKHREFVFDANNGAARTFDVFMNARRETDYSYQLQYHFDPTSGWEGERFSYELPARRTEDRTLYLNPYEDFGFMEVKVVPNRIDWGIVSSTDVVLQYRDGGGWVAKSVFTLTQQSEPETWKLRLSDPRARSYSYRFVHHLQDGSQRTTEPVAGEAAAVMVDDPFEDALDITFFPAYEAGTYRRVFVDVLYDDTDNRYRREERLTLDGNELADATLRISLLDPARRRFTYRYVFVDQAGNVRHSLPVDTDETELSIHE